MKKGLLFIGCLLIGIGSSRALTLNEDGSYTNAKNVKISSEQYKILKENYNDKIIDNITESDLGFMSEKRTNLEKKEIYAITTYTTDMFGNIIESKTIEATKEDAYAVAKNDSLIVDSQGSLVELNSGNQISPYNKTYSTESKIITGTYWRKDNNGYGASLIATWIKLPKIRQFDVMAMRWDKSTDINYIFGAQYGDSNTKMSKYYDGSPNIKKTNYGAGISMNLHDSYKKECELFLEVGSETDFGSFVYATYQHARNSNANTLAISQSYTFASNGLGGVLYYNNSKYRNYYDGMQGLTLDIE